MPLVGAESAEEDTLGHHRSDAASFLAGMLVALCVLVSLAPAVQKTYGALEVANTWLAQQTWQAGFRTTGGSSGLLPSADCTLLACTATGQVCLTGTNLYACNISTGFYEPAGAAGGSASVLHLTPLTSAPLTCSPGDVAHLTNGAFIHCYALNSWEDVGSQGVAQ